MKPSLNVMIDLRRRKNYFRFSQISPNYVLYYCEATLFFSKVSNITLLPHHHHCQHGHQPNQCCQCCYGEAIIINSSSCSYKNDFFVIFKTTFLDMVSNNLLEYNLFFLEVIASQPVTFSLSRSHFMKNQYTKPFQFINLNQIKSSSILSSVQMCPMKCVQKGSRRLAWMFHRKSVMMYQWMNATMSQ